MLLIILFPLTIFFTNQDKVKSQLNSQVAIEILSSSDYIQMKLPHYVGAFYMMTQKNDFSNVKFKRKRTQ